MTSVLQEIEKLRRDSDGLITEPWANRYMVRYCESDRTKTAYCFGVPIRKLKTNELVDLRFRHSLQGSLFAGSSAIVEIGKTIKLSNQYGSCYIRLPGKIYKKTEGSFFFDCYHAELRPTMNGVLLILDCDKNHPAELLLAAENRFRSIRANDKYFSVMREKFVPLVTASCVGVMNEEEKIIAPCELCYRELGASEYALTITTSRNQARIAVEINMQEQKLFQDTTVESKHPSLNNAFGGMAFLGESGNFGEQWLYSRLEASNIMQLQGKKLIRSVLHIPQTGRQKHSLTVNRIAARFCSFGSNWQNKIAISAPVAESTVSNGYYHLDLTALLGNLWKRSENFVIRAKTAGKPAVIPTGDNFYMPQILEVNYQSY